jgi:tetratricopeptide (TPR) repeat protein
LRNRLRALLSGGTPDLASVKALRTESAAVKLAPITLHLLARAFDLADARSEAVQVLRRACELHPTDFNSAFDLASVLHIGGDLRGAETSYRIARALKPDSSVVHGNLCGLLRQQGRLDEAAACIRDALALDERSAVTHLSCGQVLKDQGDLVGAERHLRKAVALDPGYAKAHDELGSLLLDLGQEGEAATLLRRSIELLPNSSHPHHLLGDLLAQQGKLDDAIASYRTALRLPPLDLVTHNSLGVALHEQGDDAAAVAILREGLAIDPGHAPLNFNLAMRMFDACRYEDALAALQRAASTWEKGTDDFSRQWLANCRERIAMLEPEVKRVEELLAIARGERVAAAPMEAGAAGEFALGRGDFALALQAFERAFTAYPEMLETARCRYQAACCAVQQAGRQAPAGAVVPDAERVQLRKQAREWLVDEIERWRRQMHDHAEVRRDVKAAQRDPLLAGVRDEAALATLPAREAAAWREFWAKVATMLRDG